MFFPGQGVQHLLHGDGAPLQGVVKVPAAGIVVQVQMPQVGPAHLHPLHDRGAGQLRIGVAHIQAQPQPGIVHLADDVHRNLRRRLHDVF